MFSDIDTFVVPCQHIREYPAQNSHQAKGDLFVSVKRYIPSAKHRPASKRIQVIAAGGNGFPKVWTQTIADHAFAMLMQCRQELYEPLWEAMVNQSFAAGISIDAIIIADIAHQGQSAVLNNHEPDHDRKSVHRQHVMKTNRIPASWFDNARDLLQVVNYFRAELTGPLVAVGHSGFS